jgi:hypothetical protein
MLALVAARLNRATCCWLGAQKHKHNSCCHQSTPKSPLYRIGSLISEMSTEFSETYEKILFEYLGFFVK